MQGEKLKRGDSGMAAVLLVFIMRAATGAVFEGNGLNSFLCSLSAVVLSPSGFLGEHLRSHFEVVLVLIMICSNDHSDD